MNLPTDEQRQARVVRELIAAAGGVEVAERDCDKSKSLFSAYQSPNDPRSIPLRDIEILESVTHGTTGHPVVARYLARQAGYSLMKRPCITASGDDLLRLLAGSAKAKGECETQILSDLADGTIDPQEAERLLPLFRRSIELTSQMLAELEAIAGRSVA